MSFAIARAGRRLSNPRTLGLLLAVALLATACSESADDDQTEGDQDATPTTTADTAGDTASDSDTATDSDGSADEPAEPVGPVPAGADTPGVSDDTVTISFIITDTSAVAAAFGWETPDEGDREAQLAAMIDYFNAKGGFAGRQIDAKVTVFNAITDGPVAEEALCNAITQDDKAFAVVMTGQFQENARPCYHNANTLMLDATLYPVDNAGFEALAPYYWSPILPSYDDLIGGLAAGLIEDGWFDGATLGVISIESELTERVYAEQFVPRLEAAGVEVASFNNIDPTDSTSLNNDLLQAIIDFKQAGVDKVVGIGGSRLVSFFIDVAIAQNFSPAYAVSSYDNPEFNAFNYPEMMPGASGISVMPGYDVGDEQHPFPATDAERECLDIFTNAGLAFEERNNVRTGLMFCDMLRLLQAASPHLTEVSAQGVTDAIWHLGDSFEAASVYGVEYSEGSYAGGDVYRTFVFDPECECMVLIGDPADFDG